MKQATFALDRQAVDRAGNWREIVKKYFPSARDRAGQVGIGRTLSPMRVAGARQSYRNIRAGQNPRPITNTPSHRAVSHQSAEYFSLGQLNNSTRRRTASGWARVGRVLMYLPLPGAFNG